MNPADARLERELGLASATALNMIDMIGVGPFIPHPDTPLGERRTTEGGGQRTETRDQESESRKQKRAQ